MKILLAMNSLKGSLSSKEANLVLKETIMKHRPDMEVLTAIVADGGEGSLEALKEQHFGNDVTIDVTSPVGDKIATQYWISDSSVVFIEMAKSCGLPLVSLKQRNPLLTSTFGLGEVVLHAYKKGFRHFVITLGGSATNDAGMGFLCALGYRFYDQTNHMLPGIGASLSKVYKIDQDNLSLDLSQCVFEVACDVTNPLTGKDGAAYVYAPQKGANADMVIELDQGLRHFAKVVSGYFGKDYSEEPGSGAAGGVGFALRAFLHGKLKRGVDILFEAIDFNNLLLQSDFVITGEGRMDRQTLFGKAPGEIAHRANVLGKPCFALCGGVLEEDLPELESVFTKVVAIHDKSLPLSEAMRRDVTTQHLRDSLLQVLEFIK